MDTNTHMGELLKTAFEQYGISKTNVTNNLGKSRSWIYDQFEKKEIDDKVIIQIGDAARISLKEFFPASYDQPDIPVLQIEDQPQSLYDAKEIIGRYKEKYTRLLEKYAQLLEKNNN